jgi:hypothetical protein
VDAVELSGRIEVSLPGSCVLGRWNRSLLAADSIKGNEVHVQSAVGAQQSGVITAAGGAGVCAAAGADVSGESGAC